MDSVNLRKPDVPLTCLRCQQRKIKCDKKDPCSACWRQGFTCTSIRRPRLPRGRTGRRRDGDIQRRVARLEGLLTELKPTNASESPLRKPAARQPRGKTIHQESQINNNAHGGDDQHGGELVPNAAHGSSQPSLWAAVDDEVHGIREVLTDFLGEESEIVFAAPPASIEPYADSEDTNTLLFNTSSSSIEPLLPGCISESIAAALLETYIHRVDPIFKLTHVPTLRHQVLDTGYQSGPVPPGIEAFKAAVYFLSVCSYNENEIYDLFSHTKAEIVCRLRLAAEIMLSRANLLLTSDILVLQSFVMYLAALRCSSGFHKPWTLTAIAVRIAQGLGLDSDGAHLTDPLQRELHRRTWYAIALLDMHAALDGASRPLIAGQAIGGPLPLCVNDVDISSLVEPTDEPLEFTDMSFSSMANEFVLCMASLTFCRLVRDSRLCSCKQQWTERQKIATDCEARVQRRYLQYCNSEVPFQRYTTRVGEKMFATLRLMVYRPIQPFSSAGPPPQDDHDILEMATDVLEGSIMQATDPTFGPWRWWGWVKWYSLAILLTELCSHPELKQLDRPWIVAETGFAMFSELIGDGAIWRSIGKLRRKARTVSSDCQNLLTDPQFGVNMVDNSFPTEARHSSTSTGHRGRGASDNVLVTRGFQTTAWNVNASDTATQQNTLPELKDLNMDGWAADGSDSMSWTNWEAFLQDAGSSNISQAISPSCW